MHLVASEIEAERRPGAAAQPLASYMAFARNLPPQFDDHTWLAETRDGTPVGCSACWSNAAGDSRVMESYVYVRPPWRNRRVGWQLAETVLDAAERESRQSLIWDTFDSVPAGEAFSRRVGGTVARVNRRSELVLDDVDWEMVQSWLGPRGAYTVECWEGPFPARLIDDAVVFQNIMKTAPREGLDIGDVVLDAENIAALDEVLVAAGRQRWTVFVRDNDGRCVGGTELTFEPWEPDVMWQQNTAIAPEHRGNGLAKWVKATMLERARTHPTVRRIRTANAFSNEPMLAINNALGFTEVEVRTEWQATIAQLRGSFPDGRSC